MFGYRSFKTTCDFVISLFALVLLSPFLILLSALVRLRLGSPVIFRQLRPGLHGEPFYLYKFRTMTDSRDDLGALLPDEFRLTPFGSWLRSTSLDELPGLVNILRGEMSFIGPRPLLMEYLPLYSPNQLRRHNVKPGFSGCAQVNGRNAISWELRLRLDVWYVDHQSFLLDLRIFILTFWKVVLREGITATGHVTMAPFSGSK